MSDLDDALNRLLQYGTIQRIKYQLGIRGKILWYVLIVVALLCFIIMSLSIYGYEKLSSSWVIPVSLIIGILSSIVAIMIGPYT